MDEYKKVTQIVVRKSIDAHDSLSIGKAYSYLGDYYGSKFISDSAYTFYSMAERIYLRLKENTKIAKTILNKSILQLNEKDYVGSEKSAFEALKFLKKTNDDELIYEANNILGIIYNELNEYEKSIEFHNNALRVVDNGNLNPEFQSRATSLNNIGLIYQNRHNYKMSIDYFEKALKQKDLFYQKPFLYVALIDNLAYSKFKIGDNSQLPGLFYKALKIRDSLKIIPGVINSKLNLSEYFAYRNDSSLAIKYANESYFLAKSNKLPKDVLLSLKQLTKLKPKSTGLYSQEYIRISDSLQLAERQIRNKLGRIEYETDQLVTEKANLVEQRKTLIYIALGIILIGVFIFVIRFQAAKNRELRLVQEQQAANEEIYRLMITQQDKVEETRQAEKRRIAQEIHDGVLGKLFGTRMHLGLLNDKEGNDAKMERVVYIDELKTLEQELREISHDLNSEKQAVANNFVQMVMHFIDTQRTVCKAEITITMDKTIEWTAVDSLAKINLYRILQEAFQNVNKHAQANQVNIVFDKLEGLVRLVIQDDGVGFNYTKKKKGIGMLNMRSRISSSGGSMDVITGLGQGTLLEFTLPMEDVVV
ncbi:tetratricopeptide repeat protein [Flavobacterium sp.]|uniref:tetratricopeptide repeat-containing sensor histidine kinase n=1 Tax=Flavobacterium sp. TaxID=239 RepID=UPI00262B49B3|nr:tetratricopeptide repeat protein [Flavobacterium sp.]